MFGGLCFWACPESQRWLDRGIEILTNQLSLFKSIKDGFHKEQSFNYHRFFLDYYYLLIVLLRQNKIQYASQIDQITEKMTEYILHTIRPDRKAPTFGDIDDARGIYCQSNCPNDHTGLLGLGAVLFNRSDFKYASPSLSEEILWLLGSKGVQDFRNMTPVRPDITDARFEQSGYYVMRSGWGKNDNFLILDCGPLGYGVAGHGHADALSFQLFVQGESVFCDPGSYSYNLDYDWRDYFRSTYAHNTVCIDGKSQSEMNDRMSWKTFARSEMHRWINSETIGLFDGSHNGYERLKDPVRHRRIVCCKKKDYAIVFDVLTAKDKHKYDFNLQLNPQIPFNHSESTITLGTDNKIILHFPNVEPSSVKCLKGKTSPESGWYSKNYGVKEETTKHQCSKGNHRKCL